MLLLFGFAFHRGTTLPVLLLPPIRRAHPVPVYKERRNKENLEQQTGTLHHGLCMTPALTESWTQTLIELPTQ